MPIARISGQGLTVIALCVSALWGLIIAQRVAWHNAVIERARVIQDIRQFQRRRQPERVSAPTPFRRIPRRMIAG